MADSITIKGSSREFLGQCLAEGLLTEEAAKRADQVLAENAALRRENGMLKGRLVEQRKVNKEYRAMHVAALRHEIDVKAARNLRNILLAVAGLTAALTCLAISLVMYL